MGPLNTHSQASYNTDLAQQLKYFYGMPPALRSGQLYQYIRSEKILIAPILR